MSTEAPWHAAFPAPKSAPSSISREELLQWTQEGKQAGKDFVLVDVRRTDYEGGTIKGSINLPAQSLYSTIPSLYSLISNSGAKYVIWYCGRASLNFCRSVNAYIDQCIGSCGGRGPRTAAWFADYIQETGDTEMKSLILAGGIKGWAAAGEEFTALIDGYDASVWKK
ncbi:unnamed protein product [Penicillium salamii]|nr:unnamed protein product [Penicillium salamii]CAG8248844.1 unnamed protein product [Penicillium salamii]